MTATEAKDLLRAYAGVCRLVGEHPGSGRRVFELLVIAGAAVRENVYRETGDVLPVAEMRIDGQNVYAFGEKRAATDDELAQIEDGSASAEVAS